MDIRGDWFANQLVIAQSNFFGFAIFFEGQDQLVGFGQIRQSHCYSLLEQDGEPHKIPALPLSSEDLGMVSSVSDFSSCRILGREGQPFGRLEILLSRQQQLATPAISLQGSPPPPRSLYNRFLCKQNEYTLPIYCSWRPDPQARVKDHGRKTSPIFFLLSVKLGGHSQRFRKK